MKINRPMNFLRYFLKKDKPAVFELHIHRRCHIGGKSLASLLYSHDIYLDDGSDSLVRNLVIGSHNKDFKVNLYGRYGGKMPRRGGKITVPIIEGVEVVVAPL